MALQVVLKQFTPAQAAEITGVSAGLQRQWRSLGFYKGSAGEGAFARYTAPELSALMAGRALVDGGLSYKQAAPHLSRITDAIHEWLIEAEGALGGVQDFNQRWDVKHAYLEGIGNAEDVGPYYLVLPNGEGEFIQDSVGLTRFFERHRAPGATFVSIEGAAAAIVAAAGTVGDIAEAASGAIDPLEQARINRRAWLKAYRAARKARA